MGYELNMYNVLPDAVYSVPRVYHPVPPICMLLYPSSYIEECYIFVVCFSVILH